MLRTTSKRDAGNAILNTESKTASLIFFSMQCTERYDLAMVALNDCQEAMVARLHLLVHLMRRKQLKQFSYIYLE